MIMTCTKKALYERWMERIDRYKQRQADESSTRNKEYTYLTGKIAALVDCTNDLNIWRQSHEKNK